MKITNYQLEIKLEQFTQEEPNVVLIKIQNRKPAGLDEKQPEVLKTRKFDYILIRCCNAVYYQNTIDRGTKGCIHPFPKKGDPGIAKNYRGITLTSIAAKIYNTLLLNCIEPEIEKVLWKNQNGFWKNCNTTSEILKIRRILGVRTKNLAATQLIVDFSKAINSIHRGKMAQILLVDSLPIETIAVIMMLNKNTKIKVHSPDGDTNFLTLLLVFCKGIH